MHLGIIRRLKVRVPASGPADGRGLVVHVVGPDDLGGVLLVGAEEHGLGAEVDLLVLGARVEVAVAALPRHLVEALLPVDLVHVLVLDAEGLDLEPDDADAVPVGVLVVQDREAQVVEEKDLGRLRLLLLGHLLPLLVYGRVDEPEGVPRLVRLGRLAVVGLVEDGHGSRQVVQEEVGPVLLLNHQGKRLDVLLVVLPPAQHLARLVVPELEGVGRVVDARPAQHLPEVQRLL
mmetsp:Transcript_25348/g.49448  ORF Transcript_25348/g.49448 Transcript_25348/m.49448 type:complete len:233 (-) Transcript_25348:217-915(-)